MLPGAALVLLQVLATSLPHDRELEREARSAQARFETIRRMHLPRDRWGGSGGRCDARIGRFCYWYDSTESSPAPEDAAITRARDALIALLDSASGRNPSDPWIAGQRTRYLIEAGRPEVAVLTARSCASDRWWCLALEGLSLHNAGRYAEADSVFSSALAVMSAERRCEWESLERVAGARLSRALARAPCVDRAALAGRLWALADPLWSVPGNDLRTEHFARLTMASIMTKSASAYAMRFGADSRELLIRYGPPDWYTREDRVSSPPLNTEPVIHGHDREPSYFFFPDIPEISGAPTLTSASWRLRDPTAPSRYAPRYVKRLTELRHQVTAFPRGDSLLVGFAFALRDAALAHDTVRVHVAALQREKLQVRQVSPTSAWLTLARDTAIVSIEVSGSSSKHVERARFTVAPKRASGGSLSDLLLFDPTPGDSSTDPIRLISHALTGGAVSARTPLGVYWEAVGGDSDARVWLGITVEPVRVGLAHRMAARLHLAPALAPVRLRWQSVLRPKIEGQTVTLRLPANARGRYRIVLTIERSDAASLVSSRDIEIVP